ADEALRRATIRAPIAGVVHALTVRSPGEVVEAGAVLGQVVPTGGPLEVEVLIPAARIAEVHAGQHARLKLDAFPYADYGALGGEVAFIAPDSTRALAADQPVGFRVRIAPRPEGRWQTTSLRPGMTLTAELVGRRERLGWFLLRPVRSTARALGEAGEESKRGED
ncbi:MAG: HlyD family efflux transporter periplasmic adaptor subunit, partial [Myxococcales bacterium]|nr:HlyD family efflux transporter periplasmic adaptor subunit [Myxococcales bacterium]